MATKDNRSLYKKEWYEKNKKAIAIRAKQYREQNKEALSSHRKKYYENNKEAIKIRVKKYSHLPENKAKIKKNKKRYCKQERVKIRRKEYLKEYYVKNQEHLLVYSKFRRKLPEVKSRSNEKSKNRYALDPNFRLNIKISNGIRISLHGSKKGRHWENLVGYTLKQLRKHLEKNFTEGMSWDNYGKGGWVIDHITPQIVFNFTKPSHRDFKRCWALKNLQPLWEYDNFVKHSKLEHHFQPSLLI